MKFFKRLSYADVVKQMAGLKVLRTKRQDRREAASTRRQERAVIVSHRKWIFISIAVIAVVIAILFCTIKFGGLL